MLRIALALLLILVLPAKASELVDVGEVIRGDRFVLKDGRTVGLEGIRAPEEEGLAEASRLRLESLLKGQAVLEEPTALDRYGRVIAQAATRDHANLQAVMIGEGQAYRFPLLGTEANRDRLLRLEQEARKARRGLWASPFYADLTPETAGQKMGRFAFVRGEVLDTARIKNKVYLNFGPDWRRDFTIVIEAHDLKFFKKADLDPLNLKNKTLRVRGLVQNNFGPMIAITHPDQLDIER